MSAELSDQKPLAELSENSLRRAMESTVKEKHRGYAAVAPGESMRALLDRNVYIEKQVAVYQDLRPEKSLKCSSGRTP